MIGLTTNDIVTYFTPIAVVFFGCFFTYHFNKKIKSKDAAHKAMCYPEKMNLRLNYIEKLIKNGGMMSIRNQLAEDIKKAMKEDDTAKRDALRYLMSKLQQVEVDTRKDISDDAAVDVIKKQIKQNRDSLSYCREDSDLYRKDKLEYEINAWEAYLPKQLSEEEATAAIKEMAEKIGAADIKQMGMLMGMIKKELGASIDMSMASKIVKNLLT
jgi:uncharacterized protein YqeY